MNKRVQEIAKERGLAPKDVLDRLRASGLNLKAVSSTVDEQVALRALGSGGRAGDGEHAGNGGRPAGPVATEAAPTSPAVAKARSTRAAPT
ncbi:MAG: translation initiation factor IF-2 N-terminal domain-containing protein, partial [Actinomycetota bacterium]|nr:translation initiation factor IF-2 N-terminal domain-containing protein [Actinomycetota bacterium]